jgi:hypothetical protein
VIKSFHGTLAIIIQLLVLNGDLRDSQLIGYDFPSGRGPPQWDSAAADALKTKSAATLGFVRTGQIRGPPIGQARQRLQGCRAGPAEPSIELRPEAGTSPNMRRARDDCPAGGAAVVQGTPIAHPGALP